MTITAVINKEQIHLPWEKRQSATAFWKAGEPLSRNVEQLLEMTPEVSGTSCRLILTYKMTANFFSARDRAGREKEKQKENKNKKGEKDDPFGDLAANRICRDWVYGYPIAKAGGWKRLFKRVYSGEKNEKDRLFGKAGDHPSVNDEGISIEGETALMGELKFHHAEFTEPVGAKALIGPRETARGTASNVIDFEVMPPESCCVLIIDYLPARPDGVSAAVICKKLLAAAAAAEKDTLGAKSSTSDFARIKLFAAHLDWGSGLGALNKEELERASGLGKDHLTLNRWSTGKTSGAAYGRESIPPSSQ